MRKSLISSHFARRKGVAARLSGVGHSVLVALALGLAAGPALAQEPVERLEGPVPEEVAAFRDAAERFQARMIEIEGDTRRFAEYREQEERLKLTAGYDLVLEELNATDQVGREQAKIQLEGFIERNPDSRYTSGARFRLADLYFDLASEKYLVDSMEYEKALESDDIELLEQLVPPRRDLSQAIALYEQIIEDNVALPPEERWDRLDATFLMLAFCYHDEASAQRDEAIAKSVFRRLIDEVPDSELADRSYMALGDFAFADSEYEEAIRDYRAVLAKGESSPYYTQAQYQLAWARFKLNEFDEALVLFTQLLDESVQRELDTGRESPFAPDSRKFIAFSIADLALDQNRDAIEIAQAYFSQGGEKSYDHDVYIELADVLGRYGRYDEQIQIYRHIQEQPRWWNHPDNPTYQYQIVMLYSRGVTMDLLQAGEERLALTQRYGEGTDWWEANRNNPDALAIARGYIESGLLEVAIEYFVRAQEAGDPRAFAVAAEKYQEYLDTFPIADDYYDQQWMLAQSHKYANDWEGAASNFERLVRGRRYHPYGTGARYELTNARLQQMMAATGRPEEPCTGCRVFQDAAWRVVREGELTTPVERTYTARGDAGEEISVYALTPDRQAFIEAVDALVAHDAAPVDPRLLPENYPDYDAAIDELRPKVLYMSGQILMYHNRFDEARPRFEQVIDQFPRTIEADFSAGLLLDSYIAEGNLEQVRRWSKRIVMMNLGPTSIPSDRFQSLLEGSTFNLANEIGQGGDNEGAAEAFLAFLDEFPDSAHTSEALYHAAFYYQEAGRMEQANALYEQYVQEYPDDSKSAFLFFRLASNYEAIFELERAIEHYEELRRRFPDDINAADALWNASFARVGLGQHAEAARGFEEYAMAYPDKEDREETHWRAGEQYEQVGDDEARRFYARYLDLYGLQNPDHAIAAQWRIAQIWEKDTERRWAYDRQLEQVVNTFDQIRQAGLEVGPEGHRYAAAAKFPSLQAAFDRYSSTTLTKNEDRDAAILFEQKPAELREFEGLTREFVATYQNFEWNSGALLLQAKAALYYADLGLTLTCPQGYTDELCFAYEDVLEEEVFPQFYNVEGVGVRRLVELVEASSAQKKHSPFIDEARNELNRRDPLAYPAVKRDLRGDIDVATPMALIPLGFTPPEPVAAPEPEPEPPAPEDDQPAPVEDDQSAQELVPEETP